MTDREIIQKYIGVPYVPDGTDPKTGLDCWTMAKAIYRDEGKEIIDAIDFAGHCASERLSASFEAYKEQFRELRNELPKRLDIVLMDVANKLHVGVVLGGRKMIQMTERGVSYSSVYDSRWASKIVGIYRMVA